MPDHRRDDMLSHEITELTRAIKHLARDVSLKPSAPLEEDIRHELRALLQWGHEVRALVASIDAEDREVIASMSGKRRRFSTVETGYRRVLDTARKVHRDDRAIVRELAASLSATQLALEQPTPLSLWEGVRHILAELRHLESLLARLREHHRSLSR